MVSSLSLLSNRNMILRPKNSSSRQLFLIPQLYTWHWDIHVEFPVLQSEMCWFILTLNTFALSSIAFPIHDFFFRYKFYISNNIWHWLSGSQFLCKFPKHDHLTLWTYWFHLNNFDIFCIFYQFIYKFLVFLMFVKFDMNLGDVNSLYLFFSCFRHSLKLVSLYIELRWFKV